MKPFRIAAAATAAVTATALLAPAASAQQAPGIAWHACDPSSKPPSAGYRCATYEVPLSYRDPGGPKIQLALGLLPAADQSRKRGTIFFNPGGPGNSGRFAPPLTPALHEQFDIVGFDPRGVGASTPVRCFSDPSQLEPLKRILGQFPITREQERQQVADARTVTEACGRNAGPLLGHLSTANVARDLDRLRAAAGEPRLRYYGLSYGTYVGENYANLFPGRVGALALDAVDDPVNWSTGYRPQDAKVPFSYRLGGFEGAQQALNSFLADCAADTRCAFREPGTDLLAKWNRILDRLQTGPVTIPGGDGAIRTVRYQDVIGEVHRGLLDEAKAANLARFLQAVASAPAGAAAMSTVDTPIGTPFDSAMGGAGTVCADASNPRDPESWWQYAKLADRAGRGFGSYDLYLSMPCALWPVTDPDRYTGPWNRSTAAPVLLLSNGRGDPETPHQGAQRTERLLADARLLTLDAYGHGTRGRSACIDTALERYLADGVMPPRGTVCSPDHGPFDR
ncbi:alpha/beta hydrolase [Amycolatopsis sp. NPDC059021]|uniref:alpha/beta hydrolase n=1 Tax=Amycolatopsis sp. NPDC059021 TaxID=3346704 RepID=UPI003672C09F